MVKFDHTGSLCLVQCSGVFYLMIELGVLKLASSVGNEVPYVTDTLFLLTLRRAYGQLLIVLDFNITLI